MNVFAEILFDPEYKGSNYTVGWAVILECVVLKMSSNEKIFEEIQEAAILFLILGQSFRVNFLSNSSLGFILRRITRLTDNLSLV